MEIERRKAKETKGFSPCVYKQSINRSGLSTAHMLVNGYYDSLIRSQLSKHPIVFFIIED